MNHTTDTPRTDAEPSPKTAYVPLVSKYFAQLGIAQKLERELATSKAEVERLTSRMKKLKAIWIKIVNDLTDAYHSLT